MINGTAKLHRTVRDKTAGQNLEGILVWAAAPDTKDGIRPLIMDPTEGTDEFADPIFGVESLDSPDAHHPVTAVRITPLVKGREYFRINTEGGDGYGFVHQVTRDTRHAVACRCDPSS